MNIRFIKVNLSLFEGAAGGDGGGAGEGTASGEATSSSAAGKKAGAFDNVKFGKQAEAEPSTDVETEADAGPVEEGETTSDTLEERRKAYKELIKGEYKDFYTQDTQQMIDRRFKETKNLEKQVNEFRPLLDMLTQRYNVNDVESIMKALENDDSYWESAAYDANMSVDQFKKVSKLERENKALIEQQRQAHTAQMVDHQVQEWLSQAEDMQELYPTFDFDEEMTNPEFQRLISSGVPIQHAFEVLHMDDIKQALMQETAKQTSKAVTDNIRAKGSRPLENGTSAQDAFTVKSDVTKLTKEDRAEIARRVARGEMISF